MKKVEFKLRMEGPILEPDDIANLEIGKLHWQAAAFFHWRRYLFGPLPLMSLILLALAIAALESRMALVLLLSLGSFVSYQYWRLRHVAARLDVNRCAPLQAVERQDVDVRLEIRNTGVFTVHDLLVVDRFSGSKSLNRVLRPDHGPAPGKTVILTYREQCDSGMGPHCFGPLSLILTDALGLFTATIVDDTPAKIIVYPRPEIYLETPVTGTLDSLSVGQYDLMNPGCSVSFTGIREYAPGDALRHIHWPLTMKHRQLMVKEFERSVNAHITILINMNRSCHMGIKADSTWVHAKNIALGIIRDQLEKGNYIQLITNENVVPFGTGDRHADFLVRQFAGLDLTRKTCETGMIARHYHLITYGSSLIYITPVFHPSFMMEFNALEHLAQQRTDVFCVLLDTSSFIPAEFLEQTEAALSLANDFTARNLSVALSRLARAGITCCIYRRGDDIRNLSFAWPGKEKQPQKMSSGEKTP